MRKNKYKIPQQPSIPPMPQKNKICFVCGDAISPEHGDMFHITTSGDYICGKHAKKTNRLVLDVELVEKVLEEKFGGIATIRGEVEFIINYE